MCTYMLCRYLQTRNHRKEDYYIQTILTYLSITYIRTMEHFDARAHIVIFRNARAHWMYLSEEKENFHQNVHKFFTCTFDLAFDVLDKLSSYLALMFYHCYCYFYLLFLSIDDTWEGQRQKGQIERSLRILRFCWKMCQGSSILNLSKKIDFENYVKSTRCGSISGNRLI